jgi:hypothetical protein
MLSRKFLMGFDAALVVILLTGLVGLFVELVVGGDEWGTAAGLVMGLLFFCAVLVLGSETASHLIKKRMASERSRVFACDDKKAWGRHVVKLVCDDLEKVVFWMRTSENATLDGVEVAALVRVALAFNDHGLSEDELRSLEAFR